MTAVFVREGDAALLVIQCDDPSLRHFSIRGICCTGRVNRPKGIVYTAYSGLIRVGGGLRQGDLPFYYVQVALSLRPARFDAGRLRFLPRGPGKDRHPVKYRYVITMDVGEAKICIR